MGKYGEVAWETPDRHEKDGLKRERVTDWKAFDFHDIQKDMKTDRGRQSPVTSTWNRKNRKADRETASQQPYHQRSKGNRNGKDIK